MSTAIASPTRELAELEAVIERGLATFLEVGGALARIRDERLYRESHDSFEAYCQERWHWGRRRANQLIGAVDVARNLGTAVPLPTSERQVRPLVQFEPTRQRELWQEAVAAAPDGQPTAAQVEAIVKRAAPPSLQTRRTPAWLFKLLNERFGPFKLDAFAEPHNALCKRFYTREQDGCRQPWVDVTFGNPEFDDMTAPLEQALRQTREGMRAVIIGPVGCSQAWYHELAIQGTVYVPDGRINFDLPDGTPTDRADRDTIVMAFGLEHYNPQWRKGVFRVRRLPLAR